MGSRALCSTAARRLRLHTCTSPPTQLEGDWDRDWYSLSFPRSTTEASWLVFPLHPPQGKFILGFKDKHFELELSGDVVHVKGPDELGLLEVNAEANEVEVVNRRGRFSHH